MRVRHIELHWGSEVNSQCPLFCLQEVNVGCWMLTLMLTLNANAKC